MNFIIIHGTKAGPQSNWFPWLKETLEKAGHKVSVPQFPTPEDQDVDNWLDVLDDHIEDASNTILIGHSIGCALMFNALFGAEEAFKASFFVSPVLEDIGKPEYDKLNKSFYEVELDWEDIKNHAGKVHILYGEGDAYVPKEQAEELQRHLQTRMTVIPRGGHLNSEAGFNEFPDLLKMIAPLL